MGNISSTWGKHKVELATIMVTVNSEVSLKEVLVTSKSWDRIKDMALLIMMITLSRTHTNPVDLVATTRILADIVGAITTTTTITIKTNTIPNMEDTVASLTAWVTKPTSSTNVGATAQVLWVPLMVCNSKVTQEISKRMITKRARKEVVVDSNKVLPKDLDSKTSQLNRTLLAQAGRTTKVVVGALVRLAGKEVTTNGELSLTGCVS